MCRGDNNLLESILDITLQAGTLGTVGVKEGKITPGVTGQMTVDVADALIVDPLKDITGATAAEEATAESRRQFEEAEAAALEEREAAKAQTAAEQLAASRQAGSLRTTGTTTTGSRYSDLGGDERDFLGL